LKEANGLKSDLITIGQVLKVKDGNTEQAADPVEEAPEENVEISETDAEAAAQAEAEAEQAKADEEAAAQAEAEQAKADEEAAAQAEAEQAKADEEAAAQAEAEQAKADEEAAAQAEAEQAKADEEAAQAQAKADEEKAEAEKETTQVKTETKQTTAEATPAKQETKSEKQAEGQSITVSATAYTASCNGCSGVTATGVDLNADPNAKVIAVDPSVIPLGSKVYVEGYGYATAADTGGAIQGNKIDVHVPNKNQAYGWGVKTVKVTIVE